VPVLFGRGDWKGDRPEISARGKFGISEKREEKASSHPRGGRASLDKDSLLPWGKKRSLQEAHRFTSRREKTSGVREYLLPIRFLWRTDFRRGGKKKEKDVLKVYFTCGEQTPSKRGGKNR